MGKERKKPALWMGYLRGLLMSLGMYLAAIMLLSLLISNGALPENCVFSVLATSCVIAVLCGSMLIVKKSGGSSLLSALFFCLTLVLIGATCWHGIIWTEQGGSLLLCAMAGGTSAAFLGKRKRKKGKRIRK